MYFSPEFLQTCLYIVAAALIIFIIGMIIYKYRQHAKIWDKTLTLSGIILLNTLYSISLRFFDPPYTISMVITGGLSLVAFGYIVVIIWEFYRDRNTDNQNKTQKKLK